MNNRSSISGGRGDGVDRRGFLKCMAWVGTGVIWSVTGGGVLTSRVLAADDPPLNPAAPAAAADFTFVQISDSHIGFAKEPNSRARRRRRGR